MPITINGNGTLSGISAGGYPDGTVTADDLAATLDLSGKTLSGVGLVLQIAQDTDSTQRTNSTTTYQTCGPSVAFNIIKGGSKCLVHAYSNFHSAVNNSGRGGLRLRRTVGSTTTTIAESIEAIADYGSNGAQVQGVGFTFLDTHGVGSAGTQVTYHLEFKSNGGGGNVAVNNNGSTIITVMELNA